MAFNQKKYVNSYNKETYKMFPFRVRKDNQVIIDKLENTKNRNEYLLNLVRKDATHDVLTIKEIKDTIFPVLHKHNIHEIYLFGSYARGEANPNSDLDIFCEKGDVRSLIDHVGLKYELEDVLHKSVDLIFTTSTMDPFFKEQMEKDLIKLC